MWQERHGYEKKIKIEINRIIQKYKKIKGDKKPKNKNEKINSEEKKANKKENKKRK